MTVQAVIDRKLRVAAIILNQVGATTEEAMDNAADLKAHCNLPLFCCGHGLPLPALFE